MVLVDDGLTTGMSASAAARVVRGRGASTITLAVPVSPTEAMETVRFEFHSVVCLETPPLLLSPKEWYEDFPEVTDEEALDVLTRAGPM